LLARGTAPALGNEYVLVGDGYAAQGACLAVGQLLVGRIGLGQGKLAVNMQEGIQIVTHLGGVQCAGGQVAGTDFAFLQRLAQRGDAVELGM
jgi:hypothetical protein